jgi:hypothetical protein
LQTAFGTAVQSDEWTANYRNSGQAETVSDGEGNKTTMNITAKTGC